MSEKTKKLKTVCELAIPGGNLNFVEIYQVYETRSIQNNKHEIEMAQKPQLINLDKVKTIKHDTLTRYGITIDETTKSRNSHGGWEYGQKLDHNHKLGKIDVLYLIPETGDGFSFIWAKDLPEFKTQLDALNAVADVPFITKRLRG